MRSALVLDGRFRVYDDGTITRILDGVECSANTCMIGRSTSRNQYLCVWWKDNGVQHHGYIHKLIAEAFVPNPDGKPWVMHIDSDKTNNAASNLRWATPSECTTNAHKNGMINLRKNFAPCKRCGTPTKAKSGYCPACKPKAAAEAVENTRKNQRIEYYRYFDTCCLTNREAQVVKKAKTGMRNADIAREVGLTRERVAQLLRKAELKQKYGGGVPSVQERV